MNKEYSHIGGMVLVSLFLGVTALLVSFAAGAAFETPGTNSIREVIAMCIAGALYLAFCQFWVAPRGRSSFRAKLPTLIALMLPLLLVARTWTQPVVWLASGGFGSVVGALIAHWVTAAPPRGTAVAGSVNGGRSCRNYLLAAFILMVAMALVTCIGVIPAVLADTKPGFDPGSVGVLLGATVAFDLLAAALLAFAVWGSREHDHSSKGTLGITAFLALLLALVYAMESGLRDDRPALQTASVLLVLCAVFGLITTTLVTVTSVIVDRARLCA